MKPPYCHLCGKYVDLDRLPPGSSSGRVRFRDYQPLPPDWVGHPRGMEWFCEEHLAAAERLAGLDMEEALAHLRTEFNIPAEP